MLEFNPYYRATAAECLKSPIFDSLRVKSLEEPAGAQLHLGCDEIDMFDYEAVEDHYFSSVDEIRAQVVTEASKVKKYWEG